MLTICYIVTNYGFTSILAASKDRRKVEEAMFEFCKDLNITPKYNHGDYEFQRKTDDGTNYYGWFRFEEIKEI